MFDELDLCLWIVQKSMKKKKEDACDGLRSFVKPLHHDDGHIAAY